MIWLSLCVSCIFSQIYRYRRVSGPVQRQQTKWVVYGTSVVIALVIALEIPIFLFPSFGPGSLYSLISWYAFMLALIPFPLSIGFAVQRSRLWDIDTIINRTLIYGGLTGVLALASTVILLIQQQLAQALSPQISELFIVGSVLTMVMYFKRLRRSIQSFIDRRFYARKYRAAQRLDSFTTTLRYEVSLPQISEGLLESVSEAMEAEYVSLWVNKPEPASEMPRYTGVLR